MSIIWKEEYSVQVAEIDNQHKRLFETINILYNIINSQKLNVDLKTVFDRLIEYGVVHFDNEEEYFEEFDYEETENHLIEHNKYREKLNIFYNNYIKGDTSILFELIDFLEDWWVGHVTTIDRRYINCFREHGLK
jgi:hemerythrin